MRERGLNRTGTRNIPHTPQKGSCSSGAQPSPNACGVWNQCCYLKIAGSNSSTFYRNLVEPSENRALASEQESIDSSRKCRELSQNYFPFNFVNLILTHLSSFRSEQFHKICLIWIKYWCSQLEQNPLYQSVNWSSVEEILISSWRGLIMSWKFLLRGMKGYVTGLTVHWVIQRPSLFFGAPE